MSFRTKFILTLLSATLTLYTAVGGWISTRAQQPANDPNAQLRIFESVLQHIQNDYVDEPNMEKVRAGALRGLAYGLDPYSTYLTPEQVKEYNAGNKDNRRRHRRRDVTSRVVSLRDRSDEGLAGRSGGNQSGRHHRVHRQQSHSRHFALRRQTTAERRCRHVKLSSASCERTRARSR